MLFDKKGFIWKAEQVNGLWRTHTMAPSAILLNKNTIRVFVGGWDEKGISRIWFLDLDSTNPKIIKKISDAPALAIGEEGCFDDNGVFPAHASILKNKVHLYYTGFQLGDKKIKHFNFGGLAVGNVEDDTYERVSKAPILDRADEGLFVRAGQSVIEENGNYFAVYSAGSSWSFVGGKMRPNYDVYFQKLKDPYTFADKGERIIVADHAVEHGLGRPQIIKLKETYYVFYTRRMLDMKYYFGVTKSRDLINWERVDHQIEGLAHSETGWDSEMIYFPSAVATDEKAFLFFCGNGFGLDGLGYAEISI